MRPLDERTYDRLALAFIVAQKPQRKADRSAFRREAPEHRRMIWWLVIAIVAGYFVLALGWLVPWLFCFGRNC